MRMSIVPAITGAAVLLATTSFAAPISNSTSYPLSTCIVSGNFLEEQSEVISTEVDGRKIRFCSASCVKSFEAEQTAYLEALDEAIIAQQLPNYPLESCPVSGEALGGSMGDPVNYLVGNRLVRLCCNMCVKTVAADSSPYIAKLDEAVVAAQVEAYPASTCPISSQPLGSMGEPIDLVFAGKLARLCCGGCVDKFNANPSVAMAGIYGAADEPTAGPHDDRSEHAH